MPKITCIKDVVMNDKTIAFTKGKEYKCYWDYTKFAWNKREDILLEEPEIVLKAVNNKGVSHVIKQLSQDPSHEFFREHFNVSM